MPGQRLVSLEFPLAGVTRDRSFQKQPPYTTPDALNVRACDYFKRDRGGSRPGLRKAQYEQLGSGAPVDMLGQVDWIASDGFNIFTDAFQGSGLASWWNAVPGCSLLRVSTSGLNLTLDGALGYAVKAPDSNLNTGLSYSIELGVIPYNNQIAGIYYVIGKCGGDFNPFNNGFILTADASSGTSIAFTLTQYKAGVSSVLGTGTASIATVTTGRIVIVVNIHAVTVYYNGVSIATGTLDAALTGNYMGFGLQCPVIGAIAEISDFTNRFYGNTAVQYHKTNLMAASNGTLYQRGPFTMAAVSSALTLNALPLMQTAQTLQKLYIADYSANFAAHGNDGVLTSGVLSAASIADWTTLGINTHDFMAVISNVQGAAVAMTSTITTIASGGLTLAPPPPTTGVVSGTPVYNSTLGSSTIDLSSGTLSTYMAGLSFTFIGTGHSYVITTVNTSTECVVIGDASGETSGQAFSVSLAQGNGTCTYSVWRAPKVFDPSLNTLVLMTATAGLGSVPLGCPLVCVYRGRLVWAGAADNPQMWYMSRQGNPLDYYYGAIASDGGRAVAGTSTDSGAIGESITALIPHSDDYLIFGCPQSLWLLQGDPAYNGQILNLSRTVGVIGAQSWCKIPSGEVVFLSRDGIYAVLPGSGNPPEAISREKIPLELLNIDPTQAIVSLAYDKFDKGIHIRINYKSASDIHYWFDWKNKGFWPCSFPVSMEPYSVLEYQTSEPNKSAVLFGGGDGYIRQDDDNSTTDDGTAFDSYVVIGPMRLGGSDEQAGSLDQVIGSTALLSGPVGYSVQTGYTSEQAATGSGPIPYTSSWQFPGLNYRTSPMVRAFGFALKIFAQTPGLRWAMESISALTSGGGSALKH